MPKVRDPVEGVAPGADIPRVIAGWLVVIEEALFTHKPAHIIRGCIHRWGWRETRSTNLSSVGVDPLKKIQFFGIESEVVVCERG